MAFDGNTRHLVYDRAQVRGFAQHPIDRGISRKSASDFVFGMKVKRLHGRLNGPPRTCQRAEWAARVLKKSFRGDFIHGSRNHV